MNDIVCRENLNNIVSSLEGIHTDFESYTTRLETACQAIEGAWQGYDATLFIKKMREDYKILFEDFNTCLESYVNFLKTVHPAYQTIDDQFEETTIQIGG